jgi:hypothetical protein
VTDSKPKIFVFVDDGQGTDWQVGVALAEDGALLARHVSSSRIFFCHDMGLTSERQHDVYSAYYPLGYELVEIPDDEVLTNSGLRAAFQRNKDLATETKDGW